MISLALLRHLLPRCAVCSCVASLLPAAPQGPKLAGTAATSTLVLPVRPEEMAHAPFVDAIGQPVPATVTHFGTLDLDGNRIADAFWLGDAGHGPELALAMGREQSPGRFRPWPVAHGVQRVSDAAALRQAWLDQDTLLLADPRSPYLTRLSFDLGQVGNPHLGGSFATAAFFALPPTYGAAELATANVEGDGCDDVAVVYDNGATHAIVKYRLDAPFGVPLLLGSERIDVPWPVRRLRLCDFDGDGRSDIVAELPGLGVAIALDDGSGQLLPITLVPASGLTDLAVAPFGGSAALAIAEASGVLIVWQDSGNTSYHWLSAVAGTSTASAALLPRGPALEVVAFAADGRTLQVQSLSRTLGPGSALALTPRDPAAYLGTTSPCGLGAADLDGDGDVDLVLQHPDGADWYTVRHEHTALRPSLFALSQDLSLVSLGWYGATCEIAVPAHWDLATWSELELQVMVEHPYTAEQLRWDRRVVPIDPATRRARFTVQWQDSSQVLAQFLNNPALVPQAFVQAGYLTAGGRTQLTFLGMGIGNASYTGAERRTEPLILMTDPGGNGNKSAQGVVWEQRTAPPLPKADAALLPWQ